MIDELRALSLIRERFHNISDMVDVGIGDDCAGVRFREGAIVLATTDSQVEDVHFVKSIIPPHELARRAVAVSVSDVGAMGGIPRYILASAGFSDDEDEEFLNGLLAGFESASEEFGVSLIGGNLTSSEKLFIDITVLGDAEPGTVVKRSGANAGDIIYVSGTLGDSALGLRLIQMTGESATGSDLIKRYIRPEPRIVLGRKLAEEGIATAMIDISDGLLLDLERITIAHGAGAVIDITNIPLSAEYRMRISEIEGNYYGPALSGGEDYELLFTASQKNADRISGMSEELGLEITEIGRVIEEKNITIAGSDNENYGSAKRGFVHFGA